MIKMGFKFELDKTTKLYILLALYVGSIYGSNLLGGKLMPLGFGKRGLTVSIIMLPFLFLVTDIVGEVYGKKEARRFVNIGFFSALLLLLWQIFSISMPAFSPSEWYKSTYYPAYNTIFGLSLTFTIASLIAYMVSNHIDVTIYQAMKKISPKKLIWLRNNVSTIIGQLVDATLWYLIAFSPQLFSKTIPFNTMIFAMIIPYWFARVILGIVQTPLCYLGVWWLRGKRARK
jgi:hypothetical protein